MQDQALQNIILLTPKTESKGNIILLFVYTHDHGSQYIPCASLHKNNILRLKKAAEGTTMEGATNEKNMLPCTCT